MALVTSTEGDTIIQSPGKGHPARKQYEWTVGFGVFSDDAVKCIACLDMTGWTSASYEYVSTLDQAGDLRFYAARESVTAETGLHQIATTGVNAGTTGDNMICSDTGYYLASCCPMYLLCAAEVDSAAASGSLILRVTLVRPY